MLVSQAGALAAPVPLPTSTQPTSTQQVAPRFSLPTSAQDGASEQHRGPEEHAGDDKEDSEDVDERGGNRGGDRRLLYTLEFKRLGYGLEGGRGR
jgi:hypothetical protein